MSHNRTSSDKRLIEDFLPIKETGMSGYAGPWDTPPISGRDHDLGFGQKRARHQLCRPDARAAPVMPDACRQSRDASCLAAGLQTPPAGLT